VQRSSAAARRILLLLLALRLLGAALRAPAARDSDAAQLRGGREGGHAGQGGQHGRGTAAAAGHDAPHDVVAQQLLVEQAVPSRTPAAAARKRLAALNVLLGRLLLLLHLLLPPLAT
jgi:hypothetical protein